MLNTSAGGLPVTFISLVEAWILEGLSYVGRSSTNDSRTIDVVATFKGGEKSEVVAD